MKSRHLLATAALCALAAAPLTAQTAATPAAHDHAAHAGHAPAKAAIGAWGVDLAGGDTSARAGDDFFRHTSGKWDDATEIPADRPSVGTFYDLSERTSSQLRELITKAPASSKYGALYASFMDEAKIEKLGLAPLKKDLAAVAKLRTKADFARFMGGTNGKFGITLVDIGVVPDTANPEMNILALGQSGLGLPEREYYTAPQFAKQRDAYRAYLERTMKAIGNPDPKAAAEAIFAFESRVAEKSWKIADRRDITKINNIYSTAELASYAPGIDWTAYFAGAGIAPQTRILVGENTAVRDLAALYAETPLTTLKLWQQFHIASQASPYLTRAMVDSRFDYTRSLSGVGQIRPRWKRAVSLVDTSLGDLVGQDYVARHFPASSKAKMDALVANLKVAMAGRIRSNDWMSPATKEAALLKLSRMDVMVGYPDTFRSYDALVIDAGDLYGNVQRAGKFNADYAMSDLGKKVDRKKWGMNPQTVNAYNGGLENKIVFPAGILQAPLFDPNADDAANYGAIGAIIGHEITHGFDDQGRKIDATGAVRDWWAEGDGKRFEERARVLGEQYARYEAVPGAFINPDLTMGENIADHAGLQIAYDAYLMSLNGAEPPVLDGLTGKQRLFWGWAQAWRSKTREDSLRQQVATDPHSPDRFRLFGPVRNIDAWYDAFGVKQGDKLYIAPEKRAKIW